jgi:hypothetical protein
MSKSALVWILDVLTRLVNDGYTGKIEINFFKGGISNINKFESIKVPQEAVEAK